MNVYQKTTRTLKVYQTPGTYKTGVPQIRLQGEWLDAVGFKAGEHIIVEVQDREIHIRLADVIPAQDV